MHETLITRAGLAEATERLEQLRARRSEIADRMRHAAASEANAVENADYLDAREEQAFLEHRIARLEERIAGARIAEPDDANGIVDVGERVRLHDLASGESLEYELVGSLEADPSSGRISAASPVGRALLGRRKGEIAVAAAPKGELRLEILEIEAAAP